MTMAGSVLILLRVASGHGPVGKAVKTGFFSDEVA